ncbi:hypothetical protein [Roseovarius indicus]|uniref:hypothetical protein n=1 Tax=Roseovarius indicus TaxID=540747 RepID=UPI0032EFBB57
MTSPLRTTAHSMAGAFALLLTTQSTLSATLETLTDQPKDTLSIYQCAEAQTCDTARKCVNADTRVVIAHSSVAGSPQYLAMGPMVAQASGGIFHPQEWRWILGGIPAPSSKVGRQNYLSTPDGVTWTAHVYMPGNETQALEDSGWVRADYSCEQVLF